MTESIIIVGIIAVAAIAIFSIGSYTYYLSHKPVPEKNNAEIENIIKDMSAKLSKLMLTRM